MKQSRFPILYGTILAKLLTAFCVWHSPRRRKLTREEIDHYMAIIEKLPAPAEGIPTDAIGYARRELIRLWQTLREPLVGKAERTVSMLLRVNNLEVKRLAERVHLIVDLDYAADCNRGVASWAYSSAPVVLAQEVEDRFVRLETYVGSELDRSLMGHIAIPFLSFLGISCI